MGQLRNINDPPLPVLKLTDEQLVDYIRCPNYFYFKYISQIPVTDQPTFHELVNKVIDAYMSKLMDGKIMTMGQAKRMWDKLAEEYPLVLTDKRVLDGFGYINQIDRYARQNKIIIADVNSEYQVNFKDNVIITGKTGIIRYNNNKLELFVAETSQKVPDEFLLNMSVMLSLRAYAIEKTSDCSLAGVHVYHIKTGKELYTTRGKRDLDRVESLVKNVSFSIRNEIYYPREDYLCSQCKFKIYCGYSN